MQIYLTGDDLSGDKLHSTEPIDLRLWLYISSEKTGQDDKEEEEDEFCCCSWIGGIDRPAKEVGRE